MEHQIDSTKEALKFKEGAAPSAKYKLDNEKLADQGRAKRVSPTEAKERRKTTHERNAKAAEIADKQMSSLDKEHISGPQGSKQD